MERIKEFIDDHLYYILLGFVVIIGLLIGGLIFSNQKPKNVTESFSQPTVSKEESTSNNKTIKTATSSANNSNKSSEQLYVDIKGAIKRPGVYQVTAEMRTQDVINLAGGFTKSADRKQINLAGKLADQQVIYVPLRGEIKGNALEQGITPQTSQASPEETSGTPVSNGTNGNTTSQETNDEKVNLNTADKTKLQELTGIGEKKAEQIITYRESSGKFNQIEDLKNVSGFGDKTFENLKDYICV